MELQLKRQSVAINETLCRTTVEQPIECDALLPDYCPDIVKILRCEVTPILTGNQVSGSQLTVDGVAAARVFYLSDAGCLRSAEYKIPFSRVVEIKPSSSRPVVRVSPSVGYFNCRAVSPRRLDLRGAISLSILVTACREEDVVAGAEGMGVLTRGEEREVTRVTGQEVRPFTLREELELPSDKPSIRLPLRCSGFARITDKKQVAGKIVLKGELKLHVFYLCDGDDNQLDSTDHTVPFSQILDVDGMEEQTRCIVSLQVSSLDVPPKADPDGQSRVLALEAVLEAKVLCHRNETIPLVSDCYSTQYESSCQQKTVSLGRLAEAVDESHVYQESVDLPDGAVRILDLWCRVQGEEFSAEAGKATAAGRLLISMFCSMEDGGMEYFDKTEPFTHEIDIDCQRPMEFLGEFSILDVGFTSSGSGRAEIRCEIGITGPVYCSEPEAVLTSLTVDEEHPKEKDPSVSLTIYFADAGENLWEVAKRYNTSMEKILADNGLTGTVIGEKRSLLIPM